MAEGEIAGKAAEDGPGRRQRDPEEKQIEERLDEGGRMQDRQRGQQHAGAGEDRGLGLNG